MKAKIIAFMNQLIIYDYILFGISFTFFLLLLILAILFRNKVGFSIFLALLSFLVLFLAPTFGYIEMHKYLFKNIVTIESQKKLNYTKAIVVKGNIKNISKFNFKECKITLSAYKVGKNKYKNMLYPFKPLRKMSIVENNITKGSSHKFKMFIEPFTYSKEYNLSIGAKCR